MKLEGPILLTYAIGAASSAWSAVVLSSEGAGVSPSTAQSEAVMLASALALTGLVVTVISNRIIVALNKLLDLPSKKEWDEHVQTLANLSTLVNNTFAANIEWRKSVDRELADLKERVN